MDTKLEDIPFFSRCGDREDAEWGLSLYGNFQSAILGSMLDFGMFKILRLNELSDWAKRELPDSGEQVILNLRSQFEPAAKHAVDALVFPRLPISIRSCDKPTISQVKRYFTADLVKILIILEMQKQGDPPVFYRTLCQAYLAGRFPCAWDGNYPDGQLVVY